MSVQHQRKAGVHEAGWGWLTSMQRACDKWLREHGAGGDGWSNDDLFRDEELSKEQRAARKIEKVARELEAGDE